MTGGGDSLEHFKNRLPLADIVGRYVKLTRRGREYQGLCPFHQEKSPSFNVVEEKGFYHCFGCGAHGDAISFITAVEGLSFPDALQRLSDITGIEAPTRSPKRPRVDPGLVDANAAACRYFQEQLQTGAASSVRQYLNQRGLKAGAISGFQLGFAGRDRHGLKNWLAERGINEGLAIDAGLLVKPDDGGSSFDRFRERLMIPIEDHRGRIVGFGGRALAEQKAKYLNSPETPIFHKGELLYNLKRASVTARQKRQLLVVEGYMDVIALDEGGLPEAVAPLGTAVTEAQLQLIWRICDSPVVCLDGDRAGRAAALRLARRALSVMQSGQSLDYAILPQGEDPDSLIRGRGVEAMQGLIRTAMPLSRLIWSEELNQAPSSTPEELAGLRKRLFGYVDVTADHGLKQALRDQFLALLDARRPVRSFSKRGKAPTSMSGRRATAWEGSGPSQLGASLQSLETNRDCRLLGYFLRDAELLPLHDESLAAISFDDLATEAARQEILAWYAAASHLDAGQLQHHLTRHGHGRVVTLALGVVPAVAEGEVVGADREVERLFEALRIGAARRQGGDELAGEIERRSTDEFDASRRALDQLVNFRGGDDTD